MHTYFIASPDAVKIGKTSLAPSKRLKQIQANSPVKLKLLFVIIGDFERDCHIKFKRHRRRGSEWFELSEEILAFVNGGWRTVEGQDSGLQIAETITPHPIKTHVAKTDWYDYPAVIDALAAEVKKEAERKRMLAYLAERPTLLLNGGIS